MKKWKKEPTSATFSGEGRAEWNLAGNIGKDCIVSNACEIENHYNFSGSGIEAFGEADKWPVLTLRVSFESEQEEKRNELSQLLRDIILKWFSEQKK